MEDQMKVSVEELKDILSSLPTTKEHEYRIGKIAKYIGMDRKPNPDLKINLFFEKNLNGDGWDLVLPRSHSNPVMDIPSSPHDD